MREERDAARVADRPDVVPRAHALVDGDPSSSSSTSSCSRPRPSTFGVARSRRGAAPPRPRHPSRARRGSRGARLDPLGLLLDCEPRSPPPRSAHASSSPASDRRARAGVVALDDGHAASRADGRTARARRRRARRRGRRGSPDGRPPRRPRGSSSTRPRRCPRPAAPPATSPSRRRGCAYSISRSPTATTPGRATRASPRTSSAPCSASQFAYHESSRPSVTWSRHQNTRSTSMLARHRLGGSGRGRGGREHLARPEQRLRRKAGVVRALPAGEPPLDDDDLHSGSSRRRAPTKCSPLDPAPRTTTGGQLRRSSPESRRGRDLNPRRTFQHVRDFQSRSLGRSDTSPGGTRLAPGCSATGGGRDVCGHVLDLLLAQRVLERRHHSRPVRHAVDRELARRRGSVEVRADRAAGSRVSEGVTAAAAAGCEEDVLAWRPGRRCPRPGSVGSVSVGSVGSVAVVSVVSVVRAGSAGDGSVGSVGLGLLVPPPRAPLRRARRAGSLLSSARRRARCRRR